MNVKSFLFTAKPQYTSFALTPQHFFLLFFPPMFQTRFHFSIVLYRCLSCFSCYTTFRAYYVLKGFYTYFQWDYKPEN